MDQISKTIVYPNGDVLNMLKVRDMLLQYWKFTAAEKRAFDRLCNRDDLKQMAHAEESNQKDSE